MPVRPPFKNPSPRLVNTVRLSKTERLFLLSLDPWEKKHWSESFGTAAQHKVRNRIKEKIRNQLKEIQNEYCAFCGIDLNISEIHREHIAPQYKHPHYIFELDNIVLACFDCNDFKGTKLTVENDTEIYSTTSFKILHPFRDNFNEYLECDFAGGELIFLIINRPDKVKAETTIEKLGLKDPNLVKVRGMKILYAIKQVTLEEDQMVKDICKMPKRTRSA